VAVRAPNPTPGPTPRAGGRHFDAVVTALEMLRLDGFQPITRIRREATLRGLPIIVMSSRTSRGARDHALAADANVFLPKSRHRRNLVAAVTACLNQREDGETPTGEDAQH
jgi:DNA-binding response OmpR family regulator